MNQKMPSDKDIQNMANKSPEELLAGLSEKDQKKLQAILADKELTSSIVNSPQAKMLMKMLNRGKGGK